MRKGRDGGKKKTGGEKNGKKKKRRMKIVATTSLPAVDRPNAARSRQKCVYTSRGGVWSMNLQLINNHYEPPCIKKTLRDCTKPITFNIISASWLLMLLAGPYLLRVRLLRVRSMKEALSVASHVPIMRTPPDTIWLIRDEKWIFIWIIQFFRKLTMNTKLERHSSHLAQLAPQSATMMSKVQSLWVISESGFLEDLSHIIWLDFAASHT